MTYAVLHPVLFHLACLLWLDIREVFTRWVWGRKVIENTGHGLDCRLEEGMSGCGQAWWAACCGHGAERGGKRPQAGGLRPDCGLQRGDV